jgi:hypothetical protein
MEETSHICSFFLTYMIYNSKEENTTGQKTDNKWPRGEDMDRHKTCHCISLIRLSTYPSETEKNAVWQVY